MLNVLRSTATVKLNTFTCNTPGKSRFPAIISSARLITVKTSFTATCAPMMVTGESGVERRRLRMPPSL